MSVCAKPVITPCTDATSSYTQIKFSPDLKKFGMKSLKDSDILGLMHKRVYDIAGANANNGLKVYLNGERIKFDSFKDYIKMFLDTKDHEDLIHEVVNKRWEIGLSRTNGVEDQVSIVNSINTSRGGTHCEYIYGQLSKAIIEHIKKKKKGLHILPSYVKKHMFLFVNCLIENPAFDTQTKTKMTTKVKDFGSACELTHGFIKTVCNSSIVDAIIEYAEFEGNKKNRKSDGKKGLSANIPKYIKANESGKKLSHECTLILTEGDSAKSLVVSSFEFIGNDFWGVYPMKVLPLLNSLIRKKVIDKYKTDFASLFLIAVS
jgi:DNA topoisomerase-2